VVLKETRDNIMLEQYMVSSQKEKKATFRKQKTEIENSIQKP